MFDIPALIRLSLCLLALCACGASPDINAPLPDAPAPSAPTEESQGLPAGSWALSAAGADATLDGIQHRWETEAHPEANGARVLRALPDNEVGYEVYFQKQSPRLDFSLRFDQPGLYYLWARGYPATGKAETSDLVYLGLNGAPLPLGHEVGLFSPAGGWLGEGPDSRRVLLEVLDPGSYDLNVWMAEDGFALDQLVVTRSSSYAPEGRLDSSPNMPGKPGEPETPEPGTPEPGTPEPTEPEIPEPTEPEEPAPPEPPTAPPARDFPKVAARPAFDFVDSVGVNIHLHYQDTVYNKRYADIIKPKLLELGVRHARDGIYTYDAAKRDTFYYRRWRELIDGGVRPTLMASLGYHGEATDYGRLTEVYDWLGGEVAAFEGVNEPDLSGRRDWAERTRAAQRALFEAVNAAPALREVPVLGPSVVWEAAELGDLSEYLDYGNAHPYPGGREPGWSAYGNSQQKTFARAKKVSGDKPLMATETGYHNALNTPDTHPPVDEATAAVYTPRLLLYHFNLGVKRSFLYELIDLRADAGLSKRDMHFGLLRNDGSEKPAYRALKNLLGLLDDDAGFATGELAYRLEGPEDLESALLQKQDGTFYLALWRETSRFDVKAREPRSVAAEAVRLELPAEAAVELHAFRPDGGVDSRSLSSSVISLELADTLTVLEIRP